MSNGYHIVVCAGIIPDPLQTLEPITNASGPGLKNEMMLPAVLDPWASHALYEAANLASHAPGSKVWLVSAAPKAKLQQVMMNVAQKANFELVPIDVPANGFADAHAVAALLVDADSVDSRSRPLPAASIWRMGICFTWRWCHHATGWRTTWDSRSVSRSRPGHISVRRLA